MPPKRKNVPKETTAPITREIRYCNRSGIFEALICTICQEVFDNPSRISCGHTFCRKCIHQWFETQHGCNSCPTCRTSIIPQATHRDLLALEFLSREEVFCEFAGCAWVGQLNNLDRHMAACDCDPSKVPDWVSSNVNSEEPKSALRRRLYNNDGAHRAALRELCEIDLTDSI